ncbi:MAG: single-stranded-DNA-specific exonuclease RecJ, partial [Bacteroidia bacterium]|nr:single-stranded-DNA-specific exonuclease RecJ [Bacteroidia bacterium]
MSRLLQGLFSQWELYEPDSDPLFGLEVPPPIARALHRRGIRTASDLESFLTPNPHLLADIASLPDAEYAIELLHDAVQRNRSIFIVGDYDVDGTTSVALLYSFLKSLGHQRVRVHLPDRISEGYGVSDVAVQNAMASDTELFIAVDCGTKDIPQLQRLKAAGMQIIVLDHHLVSEADPFPPADAFVNPQRPDSTYSNRYLSAAALTYRLLATYKARFGKPQDWEGVDLAAISLLADIMPLVGENRTIVQLGLRHMQSSLRPGIAALMKQARFSPEQLAYSRPIVFQIVPRLNAPGRLRDPRYTLQLLLAREFSPKLQRIAEYLEELNAYRQKLQQRAYQEALRSLEEQHPGITNGQVPPPPALVVVGKAWHKGIIGLVASKLMEWFYRPVVAFTLEKGTLVGSARSPAEIPLHQVLSECCRPFMERFGGHDRAAGLSVRTELLREFTHAFQAGCAAYGAFRPKDFVDSEISVELLRNPAFISWCDRFEPIGPQNDAPRFLLRGLQYSGHENGKIYLSLSTQAFYEARVEAVRSDALKSFLISRGRVPLSLIVT